MTKAIILLGYSWLLLCWRRDQIVSQKIQQLNKMRVSDRKTHQPSKRLSEESRPQKQNAKEMFNSTTWQSNKYSESRVQYAPERRQSINTNSPRSPFGRFADMTESGAILRPPNLPSDENRKIRVEKQQLALKCDTLMNKLRQVVPDCDDTVYNMIEQTDSRIQQLEETLKYKRDRIVGYYKVKVLSLLEKFGFKPSELSLHKVSNEAELLDYVIGKFTDKDLELETIWINKLEEMESMRMDRVRHLDEINRLNKQNHGLREELEATYGNLHQAENSIQSLSKALNSRRIEQSTKMEKERLFMDKERLHEDLHRTKNNIRQTEQYYNEQLSLLENINNDLSIKINAISKELTDARLRYNEICIKLQETKTQLDQALIHSKVEKQNAEKAERQANRWKQRFQQLDKSSARYPQIYRTPPIDYRTSKHPSSERHKTISSTEATALYDRKSVARDDKALGIFLDKEIKKLEGDLKSKGILGKSTSRFGEADS